MPVPDVAINVKKTPQGGNTKPPDESALLTYDERLDKWRLSESKALALVGKPGAVDAILPTKTHRIVNRLSKAHIVSLSSFVRRVGQSWKHGRFCTVFAQEGRYGIGSASQKKHTLQLPPRSPSLLNLVLSSNNMVFLLSPNISERGSIYTRSTDNTLIHKELIVPFLLSAPTDDHIPRPLGFLREDVIHKLVADFPLYQHHPGGSPWVLGRDSKGIQYVSFSSAVNREGKWSRTFHINQLVGRWRQEGSFEDILRGWSDEQLPIYNHAPTPDCSSEDDPVAFSIERAALPLFGFANFGCLLIAYYHCRDNAKTMLWIPRRSKLKKTWPGRLDVTVGGGMIAGETASSTIIRECTEEASLDANFVQENLHPVGFISFPNRSATGWILPGFYYLFDLLLPSDGSVQPRINAADGEVEGFELMDIQTISENLLAGAFKPSSALALVDFLIRHGFLTEETDARFVEVCLSLRRPMPWPVPWRL